MPNIALLGPPGSGKGTQAAVIVRKYGIPAIATGDALRAQLAAGTALGKKARSYMNEGRLVPDEIIIELVEKVFETNNTQKGFLFDGFPRTIPQAEALDLFLESKGRKLDRVFFLKVPKRTLIKRISNRLICPACGTSYNMSGRKTKVKGFCDHCGIELIQREDDEPGTVSKRIEVYDAQTKPLIKYYTKQGKLIRIDGTKDIESQQAQIGSAIEAI